MTAKLLPTIILCGIFTIYTSLGQEHIPADHLKEEDSHFRISSGIAHTYLPEKTVVGTRSLVLPTVMLDIEYWFNHSWGIGLHNDLELFTFEVIEDDELFIERDFPVLLTFDVLWKPYKDLVLFFGPGIEIEPTENYLVIRAGFEYEIPFSPHWDFSPLLYYDVRDGAYNTFTIGLGVGYSLGGFERHDQSH